MKRSAYLIASVFSLILFFHSSNALAIYSWTDENGVFHMSDLPRPKGDADTTTAEPEETGDQENIQATAPAKPEPVVKTAPAVSPTAPEPIVKTTPTQSAGSNTQQPSVAAAPVSATVKSGQTVTLIMIQQRPDVPSTASTPSVTASPQTV